MTINEWLDLGQQLGFCSPPACGMHDGMLLTELKTDAFDAGEDPCFTIVRVNIDRRAHVA